MNPKNTSVYTTGLITTLMEKLFFLQDNVNLDLNNKIIIDFGCGEGSLLSFLHKRIEAGEIKNSYLVAVEQNELFLNMTMHNCDCDVSTTAFLKSFNELEHFIKDKLYLNKFPSLRKAISEGKPDPEIVVIFSSVLHEVGYELQKDLCNFCATWANYIIIRDMRPITKGLFMNWELAEIIRHSNPNMLADFTKIYGFKDKTALHYLLKYTYVDNWESEVLEDYTSVCWKDWLKLGTPIWIRDYLQPWRRHRVIKDFGIDLSREGLDACTHRELIIKVKSDTYTKQEVDEIVNEFLP